ncbi:MAG TPA: NAD(P)-dependent oxidoreductase [Chryseosolibacter sp.]
MEQKRILVTGGAGYIGSVLVRLLLRKGYAVTVVDNLSFGGEPILDLLNDPNFTFFKEDIRNTANISKILGLQKVYAVAHLAAIVGDPACAKDPALTKSINWEGSKGLYEAANAAGVEKFIFASTCSNYGKMKDSSSFVDENSELAPVSLYAETKVQFEQYLFSQPKTNTAKPTSLRFSTVYGLSLRPRFDLTVNEFTKDLAMGKELVIFGEQFWRPYCHVEDLALSVIKVIESKPELVSFDVFNVGDTSENYQKQMIVEEIKKFIPGAKVSYVQRNEDPRDYRVTFEKIKKQLGFSVTKRVPDGIAQIKFAIDNGFLQNPDDGKYKNVQ